MPWIGVDEEHRGVDARTTIRQYKREIEMKK